MHETAIYLDNNSTTQIDPRVLDAMLPFFTEQYGNAASVTHAFGHVAKEAVDAARATIASAINVSPQEIVFTSGATESNNLAIRGVALHPRAPGKHIVSVATEHKAVLDPLKRLEKSGYEITLLPVAQHDKDNCGIVDLNRLSQSLRDDTCLVTIMTANNEIGAVQPIREIAAICRDMEIPLHTDAAQAIGKFAFDTTSHPVDLASLTAHKIHGPKGIGALYVRSGRPRIRLLPQIDGGGHENGMRSGTLNVPAIVGFAKAVEIACNPIEQRRTNARIAALRTRLFGALRSRLNGVHLNGPILEPVSSLTMETCSSPTIKRLSENLNCRFDLVDGEALAINMTNVAVSTGSACTSADPQPSHVLKAIGLSEDQSRSSIRFGLSRFTTDEQIDIAIQSVVEAVTRLRKLSSMG